MVSSCLYVHNYSISSIINRFVNSKQCCSTLRNHRVHPSFKYIWWCSEILSFVLLLLCEWYVYVCILLLSWFFSFLVSPRMRFSGGAGYSFPFTSCNFDKFVPRQKHLDFSINKLTCCAYILQFSCTSAAGTLRGAGLPWEL